MAYAQQNLSILNTVQNGAGVYWATDHKAERLGRANGICIIVKPVYTDIVKDGAVSIHVGLKIVRENVKVDNSMTVV